MDASLQNYSSGMSARLSFALAASMAPDVMLVDEVLAVGDLAFQRKCVNHLRSYLAGGGSLVIVSHNVHQIQSICTQALLLDHGRVGFRGSAADTLNRMFENRIGVAPPAPQTQASQEPLTITNVSLEPLENDAIRTGRPLRIVLRYYAQEAVRATWGFNFWTADHWVCVTGDYQAHARVLDPGEGTLSCIVPRMPLEGGRYLLRAAVFADETRNMLALYGWEEPAPVHVLAAPGAISNVKQVVHQLVTMDVEWS
jgi:energy-coupling factor transporter ATP-binding protein EcfA2